MIVIHDSDDEGAKVDAKKGSLLQKQNLGAVPNKVVPSNWRSSIKKEMVVVEMSGYTTNVQKPTIRELFPVVSPKKTASNDSTR